MELHLGLALPGNNNNNTTYVSKLIRPCLDNQPDRPVPRTLPLLSWSNHPNGDPNPPRHLHNDPVVNQNDEEGVVVGWPPIKSWRRMHVAHQAAAGNYRFLAAENGSRRAGPNSKFVKVKMEGVGIARKIDLSLFDSHRTLVDSLTRRMFHVYRGSNSMDDYKLVYQDLEGDWLLAADVPWRTFVRNAQRLKLARTGKGV